MLLGTLAGAAHQQLAVDHAADHEGFGNLWKAKRNIVAGSAVETGLAAGMGDLDADPVPFPLGREVVEADAKIVERLSQHEWPEQRHVLGRRLFGPSFRPGQ